nr:AAA family ATPase [Chlorobium sp. KB01]
MDLVRADEHKTAGEFILTGSHQFELNRQISQSLAGRSALLKLLPLSIAELCDAGHLSPAAITGLIATTSGFYILCGRTQITANPCKTK